MLVLYNMICFSPLVPDVKVRYYLGFVACGLVCIHLLVNFYFIAKESLVTMKRRYKMWKRY